MITEKENTINMEKCPRFISCSIPKCPLEFFMSERPEYSEDGICSLRRITEGKMRRGKIKKDILNSAMKKLVEFVPKQNLVEV